MNNLSWTISWTAYLGLCWANDNSILHTLTMTNLTTFSWFSPFLGGKRIGNLKPALLPNHLNTRGGAGGVAGWALPCFPSLLTCGRGRWAGDNPDAWQLYPSYVLRSVLPGNSFPTVVLTHTLTSNSWFSFGQPVLFPSSSLLFSMFTSHNPLLWFFLW